MKPSADLGRMLATLRNYYSADLIATVMEAAEQRARARGGRQITRADFDAAAEQDAGDAPPAEQDAGDAPAPVVGTGRARPY